MPSYEYRYATSDVWSGTWTIVVSRQWNAMTGGAGMPVLNPWNPAEFPAVLPSSGGIDPDLLDWVQDYTSVTSDETLGDIDKVLTQADGAWNQVTHMLDWSGPTEPNAIGQMLDIDVPASVPSGTMNQCRFVCAGDVAVTLTPGTLSNVSALEWRNGGAWWRYNPASDAWYCTHGVSVPGSNAAPAGSPWASADGTIIASTIRAWWAANAGATASIRAKAFDISSIYGYLFPTYVAQAPYSIADYAFDATLEFNFTNCQLYLEARWPVAPVTIYPPTPPVCAVHEPTGTLAVAWFGAAASGVKPLYIGVHRGVLANAGSGSGSTAGWAVYTYSSTMDERSKLGLAFLPSGRLCLTYDTYSGSTPTAKVAMHDLMGRDLGGWGAAATLTPNAAQMLTTGWGMQQLHRARVDSGNALKVALCRDAQGAAWGTEVQVDTGVDADCGGVAWMGDGYGALYSKSGTSYWKTTPTPASWSGSGAATSINGAVSWLSRHPAGILAAIIGGAPCVSRDRGATWSSDTTIGGNVPLICWVGDALVALCPQDATSVKHWISNDCGVSWL